MQIDYRVIPGMADPRSDDTPLVETAANPVFEPPTLTPAPEEVLGGWSGGLPIAGFTAPAFPGYVFGFWNVTKAGVAVAGYPNPSNVLDVTQGDSATAWYIPEGVIGGPGDPSLTVRAFDGDANRFRRMTPIDHVTPSGWAGPNHRDIAVTNQGQITVLVKEYLDSDKKRDRWLVKLGVNASDATLIAPGNTWGYAVVGYKAPEYAPPNPPRHRYDTLFGGGGGDDGEYCGTIPLGPRLIAILIKHGGHGPFPGGGGPVPGWAKEMFTPRVLELMHEDSLREAKAFGSAVSKALHQSLPHEIDQILRSKLKGKE